jgi:hypothetical protein
MSNFGCDTWPVGTILVRSRAYTGRHSEASLETVYAVVQRMAGHADQVLTEVIRTHPDYAFHLGSLVEGYPDDFEVLLGVTRTDFQKEQASYTRFDLDLE